MASETQIFSREMILSAYKAVRQLSRTLYKSTLFMQNKANLLDDQMNISSFITSKYEKLDIWWIGKNKANSKPNKANFSYFPVAKRANPSLYSENTNPERIFEVLM